MIFSEINHSHMLKVMFTILIKISIPNKSNSDQGIGFTILSYSINYWNDGFLSLIPPRSHRTRTIHKHQHINFWFLFYNLSCLHHQVFFETHVFGWVFESFYVEFLVIELAYFRSSLLFITISILTLFLSYQVFVVITLYLLLFVCLGFSFVTVILTFLTLILNSCAFSSI